MSEFERTEMENGINTTETYSTTEEPAEDYPVYGYPVQAENESDSNGTNVGLVFAAGATAGALATKLVTTVVRKVKDKVAEKEGNKPPVKEKKRVKWQLPWRIEKYCEVPMSSEPEKKDPDTNNSGETPQA